MLGIAHFSGVLTVLSAALRLDVKHLVGLIGVM